MHLGGGALAGLVVIATALSCAVSGCGPSSGSTAPRRQGPYPQPILNRWDEWPEEFFVRYWDERWWTDVIRPRVDQALRAGFDGVYLDTPWHTKSWTCRWPAAGPATAWLAQW